MNYDMQRLIKMSYIAEQIAETLQNARKQKGLSQRALSARTGVPQSHISKIESNAVDLRLSSLAAIAHALDLELALVPRKAVPAVKSVTRSVETPPLVNPAIRKEFRKIKEALNALSNHPLQIKELDQLQRQYRELNQLQNLMKDTDLLRNIRTTLENMEATGQYDAITRATQNMRTLRNTLAHAQNAASLSPPTRPAYRLEGGEDE